MFEMTTASRTKPECGDSEKCERDVITPYRRMSATSLSHLGG